MLSDDVGWSSIEPSEQLCHQALAAGDVSRCAGHLGEWHPCKPRAKSSIDFMVGHLRMLLCGCLSRWLEPKSLASDQVCGMVADQGSNINVMYGEYNGA